MVPWDQVSCGPTGGCYPPSARRAFTENKGRRVSEDVLSFQTGTTPHRGIPQEFQDAAGVVDAVTWRLLATIKERECKLALVSQEPIVLRPAQNQRGILAAEGDTVGHGVLDLEAPAGQGHVVEIALRI